MSSEQSQISIIGKAEEVNKVIDYLKSKPHSDFETTSDFDNIVDIKELQKGYKLIRYTNEWPNATTEWTPEHLIDLFLNCHYVKSTYDDEGGEGCILLDNKKVVTTSEWYDYNNDFQPIKWHGEYTYFGETLLVENDGEQSAIPTTKVTNNGGEVYDINGVLNCIDTLKEKSKKCGNKFFWYDVEFLRVSEDFIILHIVDPEAIKNMNEAEEWKKYREYWANRGIIIKD